MDWYLRVKPDQPGEFGSFSLEIVTSPEQREIAVRVAHDFSTMLDRTIRLSKFIDTLK